VLISVAQLDCGHFKKTNEWLKQRYGDEGEINWDLDLPAVEAGI
jgi:uracil-DNA glycosylase